MEQLLKDKLSKLNITGWQIHASHTTSTQSFLAKEDRECQRQVKKSNYEVTLHKKSGDNLGIASFVVGPQDINALDQLFSDALLTSDLVKNQPFELPGKTSSLPNVEICDNNLNKNSLAEFESRIINAVKKEKDTRLSAAEFFIDQKKTKISNHLGLEVEQEETQLHTEFILLSKDGGKENEFIDRYTRRFIQDFNIEEEVAKSAAYARDATRASLPKTGKFPVLITGEPLDHLYNPLIARSSARVKYLKMLEIELGKSVVADGDVKGDTITLWSNGLLKGGVGSNRFDSYGTPMQKLCLIEKNILKNYLADKRYSDYLKIPASGELGNIEIEPGKNSFETLKDPGFSNADTLIVLEAFSAFEPNPITGAYSAEIRAGYEISPKGTRPIKGGAVSGVLQKDLLHCHLSKERVQRERALVPKGILFNRLTIAGE